MYSPKVILVLSTVLFSAAISFCQDGYVNGSPKLAYWKMGRDTDVVIMLHGGPFSAHNYLRPEWDSLSKFAQVVYYDQRGCGRSEKADCYSWQDHVLDLQRIIKTVAQNKKVYLIGSSWGSTLALLYAYTFPKDIKGIVLSGTVRWKGQGLPRQDCSAYIPRNKKAERERDSIITMPFFIYRTYSDTTFVDPITYTKTTEVHSYNRLFTEGSLVEAPGLAELKKIQVPILIFRGEEDCKGHADAANTLMSVLPNAKVVAVAGACHDPWYTHKHEVMKKCIEFITK